MKTTIAISTIYNSSFIFQMLKMSIPASTSHREDQIKFDTSQSEEQTNVDTCNFPNQHLILYGASGWGKTRFIKNYLKANNIQNYYIC